MDKADAALLEKPSRPEEKNKPEAPGRDSSFARRHIGPNDAEIGEMLDAIGFENLDALIDATVPKSIRLDRSLDLPAAKSESEALAELRAISKRNKVARSY
ncbi:MAG: glycine dehydrogenase (aminomethyl-transferring), partial [Verrucomicrobiota bacterium]|nr:glycine dehydrogenase (aminomethyl-transferring) [Verrucomicrobiota bacterium]